MSDDLYTVGYVLEGEKTVKEAHVCGPLHLATLLNLLEDSERVSKFKVTSSGMTLEPESFGYGDYKKWVQVLFPKTNPEQAHLPANCRQRLLHEGKSYPKSSCGACGPMAPKWRECAGLLTEKKETHPPGTLLKGGDRVW